MPKDPWPETGRANGTPGFTRLLVRFHSRATGILALGQKTGKEILKTYRVVTGTQREQGQEQLRNQQQDMDMFLL